MINSEEPPDAAQAITCEVELQRCLFGLLSVTERERRWGVLATAELALAALAPSAVKAGFHLPL